MQTGPARPIATLPTATHQSITIGPALATFAVDFLLIEGAPPGPVDLGAGALPPLEGRGLDTTSAALIAVPFVAGAGHDSIPTQ